MNKIYCIMLIGLMFSMQLFINIKLTEINKSLKEVKEVKMIVDNLESLIKLLTPPPEFFTLPVVRGKQ